ncbi:peptidyl-prolyl cis-trans isomerase FKBP14 [Alligator mississippiensis]|uniref:peptidylprolyl isomerase n=1 Tax=Alligator mississippiensis TaxID=8496 RepID=A0A151MQQ1_ALLMI|nr:peptidyl-prolyl cis-trans isomerase FKBP14 [Alligator mississippiensis]
MGGCLGRPGPRGGPIRGAVPAPCRVRGRGSCQLIRACLGAGFATSAAEGRGRRASEEAEVTVEVLQKPFICHRKTKWGDMMLVHYEGYLEKDGSMFHSTHKHNNGQPMWFTLGIKEAIKGWDKGLKDMCVGEKRKLTIPPSLGYGKEGKGKIPPESTLIFNIDLLEIRNGPRSHESFQEMDLNDDWKLSKDEVKIYLKKEFEKHGAAVNDSQHDVLIEDIFDKEDEDSDGFISAREFTYKHDEL